jgi:hypothetical protein
MLNLTCLCPGKYSDRVLRDGHWHINNLFPYIMKKRLDMLAIYTVIPLGQWCSADMGQLQL